MANNFLRRTLTYLTGFPNILHYLYDIVLSPSSWQTLFPNMQLDDNIINCFCLLVQDVAKNNELNIQIFETFVSEQLILNGKVAKGFTKWAVAIKVWETDVWLLPVHIRQRQHWTMLIVNLNHKCFLYINSLRQEPPNLLMDGIVAFIDHHCRPHREIRWEEWKLFAPIDIPDQTNSSSGTANNCGTHILTWTYSIATSSFTSFDEDDMPYCRMGIAQLLKKGEKCRRNKVKDLRNFIFEDEVSHKIDKMPTIPIARVPPMGFQSTLEYCASLKHLIPCVNPHFTRSQRN